MAAGDITSSAPTECIGMAAVEVAVEALNLAAATDFIHIIPINGRDGCYFVFKSERAAA